MPVWPCAPPQPPNPSFLVAGNQDPKQPVKIPIRGLAVGNGFSSPCDQIPLAPEMTFQMGLISEKEKREVRGGEGRPRLRKRAAAAVACDTCPCPISSSRLMCSLTRSGLRALLATTLRPMPMSALCWKPSWQPAARSIG